MQPTGDKTNREENDTHEQAQLEKVRDNTQEATKDGRVPDCSIEEQEIQESNCPVE